MTNILVFGSSGHAKVITDIIRAAGRHQIIGLIDNYRDKGATTLGLQVLGAEKDIPHLIREREIRGIVLAVGDNYLRFCLANRIRENNPTISFVTVTHPDTTIGSDVVVGEGTVVMPGVRINASCHIGRLCILNTNSSLDHDCKMGNFSSLAPGVATGGNCSIGDLAALCIGTCIAHGVRIGHHTVVGAGSTVLRDIGAFKTAFGSPAVEYCDRKPGDAYL